MVGSATHSINGRTAATCIMSPTCVSRKAIPRLEIRETQVLQYESTLIVCCREEDCQWRMSHHEEADTWHISCFFPFVLRILSTLFVKRSNARMSWRLD